VHRGLNPPLLWYLCKSSENSEFAELQLPYFAILIDIFFSFSAVTECFCQMYTLSGKSLCASLGLKWAVGYVSIVARPEIKSEGCHFFARRHVFGTNQVIYCLHPGVPIAIGIVKSQQNQRYK